MATPCRAEHAIDQARKLTRRGGPITDFYVGRAYDIMGIGYAESIERFQEAPDIILRPGRGRPPGGFLPEAVHRSLRRLTEEVIPAFK